MKTRKPSEAIANLKSEKAYLTQLVKKLKSENAKLQKKIANLEAKDVTSQNRIKILEKQKLPPETKPVSDLELARSVAFILNRGGLDIHGKPSKKKP